MTGADVARRLKMSKSAVSRAVAKGEKIAADESSRVGQRNVEMADE